MRALFHHPLARVAAVLGAALAMTACGGPTGDGKPVKSSADEIARGKYLARAADCAACHTAPGGAPMAGGAALESEFGALYGSNITPDPQHGIGKWSKDDFYKAVHDGTSPGARQLYPAMPYASYRAMPREDVDAIYAYLMQLPAVAQPSKPDELRFPYNMRFGMFFWKILFLKDELPVASQGQSPEWVRGRYVSNVLGHCAECHTPRGALGQLDLGLQWQGAQLGRWLAPDITPKGLAERGWTEKDIGTFMKTGVAPQGSAWGEMHTVVALSTQHLTDEDSKAMVRFMTGDKPLAAVPAKEDPGADQKLGPGRQTYLNVCAGCHGVNGEGRSHVAVAMAGNSTLRIGDPRNLVVSVLDGIEAQQFTGYERMQEMPGFADKLSDAEVADLSNYLRVRFAGQPASVTAEAVSKMRAKETTAAKH
ncbi:MULTISPECIES: cytochrome c [unclassified Variovorax]|uniref:c-type cytochrome n=1 Tax=unclassified Variovorax TaxID=663243 RepID=UPI001BD539B0|nr:MULTISPECIES: cytochrome c [unclassified Variovorax]